MPLLWSLELFPHAQLQTCRAAGAGKKRAAAGGMLFPGGAHAPARVPDRAPRSGPWRAEAAVLPAQEQSVATWGASGSIVQTRDTRAERVFLVGVELKSGNIAIGDSGILL